MITISILPKHLKRGEFMLVPKREYEKLVRSSRVRGKAKKLPSWLRASLREAEEGKLVGPFHSVKELMADLER